MHYLSLYILKIFLCLNLGVADHDFHLSKSVLKYKQDEKALQLSLHVFIDDLEAALLRHGYDSLYISTSREKPIADTIIAEYVNTMFGLKVNDQEIKMDYLGKEQSEDKIAIWMYFEALSIERPVQLDVRNAILMDLFDDQQNVMNLHINDKWDHALFSPDKTEKTFRWKR